MQTLPGSSELLQCWWRVSCADGACSLQGSSCALVVNGNATGGVAPPTLEFNEMAEPPATTAARHAARYFNNVHPVGGRPAL